MQGDKYTSLCILLHRDMQFEQHHLLKILHFFQCMVLASLSNVRCIDLCLGLQLDISDECVYFCDNTMLLKNLI